MKIVHLLFENFDTTIVYKASRFLIVDTAATETTLAEISFTFDVDFD